MKKIVALSLLPLVFLAHSATATPVGSYTFCDSGNTIPGAGKIRVTAVTKKNAQFDSTFTFGGNENCNQIRNTIKTSLAGDGFNVQDNGQNGISITGKKDDPISKVDGGSTIAAPRPISLDGNVDTEKVKPGAKWKVSFAPGLSPSSGLNALVTLDLGGLGVFATQVDSDPSLAAQNFFDFLDSSSFTDAVLITSSNEVEFLLAPGSVRIGNVQGLFGDSPALHLGLTLPEEVPEPITIALVGLGIAGISLARTRLKKMPKIAEAACG